MCENCTRIFGRSPFRSDTPLLGSVLDALFEGATKATEPKAVPEDRPQDLRSDLEDLLRRLEVLERWAIRKVKSDLKGALRRAEEKKEGEDRARETDSVLASHNERTDSLVDRVAHLEVRLEAERQLRRDADQDIADLRQSLKAQGRQLEELLLWRESVMETEDIVADENAMGAIAEAEGDANTVLPGDAEGGDQ